MIRTSCACARLGLRNTTGSGTPIQLPGAFLRGHPAPVGRRIHASKAAAQAVQTIPGPSWLWLQPIYEPFRAYGRVQQRRPYMTQFVSALVIYFIGDVVAQSIAGNAGPEVERSVVKATGEEEEVETGWVQQWSDGRDWSRTGRALVIGGLSSIPSYNWFLWLSNNFNYRSRILSLMTKVFINQAFFTPLFNCYFFGMQSLLSGATLSECIERIKNTVPTSWTNSCKVWPMVTAFSFTYVPIQYRSVFGGVIAIGWQTYLNLLNQQAAALEAGEQKYAVIETTQRFIEIRQAIEKEPARLAI